MAIGVKETQEIIRQAAVLSRSESSLPVKLDPQEAGMATGPRFRNRSLMRPGAVPEYLRPGKAPVDAWQKLDDDIYKFLQMRKDQFGRLPEPPSHQFIAEVEAQLKFADPEYQMGSFLGLVRLAADLDQTRTTYVTASEKNSFHAFARRLTEGRRDGEAFDPDMVKRYRDLLETDQATTYRGLADLFRLVSRAARLPLIGNMGEAPALSINVMLQVVDLAARFNQGGEGARKFQVGPMDVFLAARSVLFNRSVANPTLSMVKELVLDESGLYHEDLREWLVNVGVFGSEHTLLMPESLCLEAFSLQGATYSAMELVMMGGLRLAKAPARAGKALATFADALLYKVQQQDGHKDLQVQSILQHFNLLLHSERRSASRVIQERQQARFDYVNAIQRAGQLAREIQTGQFAVMAPVESPPEPAYASSTQAAAAPETAPGAASAARASIREQDPGEPPMRSLAWENGALLADWDALVTQIRKKLSSKSPVFKSMISQLAGVRSLDTCRAFGLTPGGSRCIARLGKLLQGEETRVRLGIGPGAAETLENAFSSSHPEFMASLEALVITLYDFKPGLKNLQFRDRDRKLFAYAGSGAARETLIPSGSSDLDETVLNLVLGSIRVGGGEDGSFGQGDPFLGYCALLWVCKHNLGRAPLGEPEVSLQMLAGLSAEWKQVLIRKARDLAEDPLGRSPLVPGLDEIRLRPGWERGFEMGFMEEVRLIFEETGGGGSGLDQKLLMLLAEIQPDIERANEAMERDKLRLTRDRVMRILD